MNLAFFNSFVRNPRHVGSLMPSSRYLGETMKEMVDDQASDHPLYSGKLSVAVLGIGTGAVAKSFIEHDVYGYDLDRNFLAIAGRKLPSAELRYADVCAPGFSLEDIHEDHPIAIVSCIPLVNLGQEEKARFQTNVMTLLEDPRALCFMQYSYLPRVPLELPGLAHTQRWVLRNVPPAGIFMWQPHQASAVAKLRA